MENTHKNHTLIRYDLNSFRARYKCIKCNLYFSFSKKVDVDIKYSLFIAEVKNFVGCSEFTPKFIDLTCEEVLIKRLLE